jgi:hypothetical protein
MYKMTFTVRVKVYHNANVNVFRGPLEGDDFHRLLAKGTPEDWRHLMSDHFSYPGGIRSSA